jgi:hypothetical protein
MCMVISQRGGSSGHYMVISSVLVVKFWTNNGTRGCNNPTKTSTSGLPSIDVLPYTYFETMVLMYMVISQ